MLNLQDHHLHQVGMCFLQQLLANARISIEEYSYDNWDGGQYGFLLRLQVPDDIFAKSINDKDKYEGDINEKLGKLIKIPGEFIASVSIEMKLVEDILDMYDNSPDITTQVIAASIRHPEHCLRAALIGAHIAPIYYIVSS